MSHKITKSYAYTVRVDDKSTYDQVKKYLTHFQTLDHYKSERIVDLDTDEDYIKIYVDFTGSIGLRPSKMCGAMFSKCKKIPKQEANKIFNGHNIMDTIVIDLSDESSEFDNDYMSVSNTEVKSESDKEVKSEPDVEPKQQVELTKPQVIVTE